MLFRVLSIALLAFTLVAPGVSFAGQSDPIAIANTKGDPGDGHHKKHGPKNHGKKKHGKKKHAKKSRHAKRGKRRNHNRRRSRGHQHHRDQRNHRHHGR